MWATKAMLKLLQLISHSICAEGVKAIQRKREKAECAAVKSWGHRFIEWTQLRITDVVEMCPTAWEALSKVSRISSYHIRKLQLLLVFCLILATLLLIFFINTLYYMGARIRTQEKFCGNCKLQFLRTIVPFALSGGFVNVVVVLFKFKNNWLD